MSEIISLNVNEKDRHTGEKEIHEHRDTTDPLRLPVRTQRSLSPVTLTLTRDPCRVHRVRAYTVACFMAGTSSVLSAPLSASNTS